YNVVDNNIVNCFREIISALCDIEIGFNTYINNIVCADPGFFLKTAMISVQFNSVDVDDPHYEPSFFNAASMRAVTSSFPNNAVIGNKSTPADCPLRNILKSCNTSPGFRLFLAAVSLKVAS